MKRGNVAREVERRDRDCWSRGGGDSSEQAIQEGVRKQIVKALPQIVEALLTEACAGSAVHLKLLLQMERVLIGPGREGPREKNLEEILTEQWARDEQRRLLAKG